MPAVLIFNPGSASLKFEIIEVVASQPFASSGKKLVSASIEEIGKDAKLLVFDGREIGRTERTSVSSMVEGTRFAIAWLRKQRLQGLHSLDALMLIGVRVVHGGDRYDKAVSYDENVRRDIDAFKELAPLHNQSSLDIIDVAREELSSICIAVAFDTAFHQSLPETAWRYAIERKTADKYRIRKYGFHGLTHRYMLETYAQAVCKQPGEVSLVTMHLESGSSTAAIAHGQSVDTTMGMTPLEGLMMGTRSGSIDPAIVAFLSNKAGLDLEEVMTLLNKRSGLLGIAGETLDTRKLVKRTDNAAKLAMAMFSYRVRLAVGAYLAALGDAEAIVFGGGIGEDTPTVRADVCAGLHGWGLQIDSDLNARWTSGQVCLSPAGSRLQAWVIPVEEGLQIAHECFHAIA